MDIKERCRQFSLLLYPEDESHVNALEYIKQNYTYSYILHDSDVEDTGEIKKEHWHVVIQFKNARSLRCVVLELGIQPNYIQCCRSYRGALRYLTHKDDDDKYQYSLDNIQTNCENDIKKAYRETVDEDTGMIYIFDYIDEQGEINQSQFVRWVLSAGYYSHYRRSSYIVNQYINEHNKQIANDFFRKKQEELNKAIYDKADERKKFIQTCIDWNEIM